MGLLPRQTGQCARSRNPSAQAGWAMPSGVTSGVEGQVCRPRRLGSMHTCPFTRAGAPTPDAGMPPAQVSGRQTSGCRSGCGRAGVPGSALRKGADLPFHSRGSPHARCGYAARSGERTAYLVLLIGSFLRGSVAGAPSLLVSRPGVSALNLIERFLRGSVAGAPSLLSLIGRFLRYGLAGARSVPRQPPRCQRSSVPAM